MLTLWEQAVIRATARVRDDLLIRSGEDPSAFEILLEDASLESCGGDGFGPPTGFTFFLVDSQEKDGGTAVSADKE